MRAAVTAALGSMLLLAGCGYPDPTPAAGPVAGIATTQPSESPGAMAGDSFAEGAGFKPVSFPDGLQIVDLTLGTGEPAASGATVKVQYTGWLRDGGKKFDSSRERGQAFEVGLGQQQVIPGWDEGVPGMKAGGRRKLIIPPALGYGAKGSPPVIPPESTLVFTIELVSITTQVAPSPKPSAGP